MCAPPRAQGSCDSGAAPHRLLLAGDVAQEVKAPPCAGRDPALCLPGLQR